MSEDRIPVPTALQPYRDRIAASVVFEHLDASDLDRILGSCELLDVPHGGLILTEGTPTDGLYVILEGQVEFFLPERVERGLRRPTRIRLNVLEPGRGFGEYGLIDDRPASASARALTPTRLCFLPKSDFRRLVGQNDRMARTIYANLLRFLVSRLRGKDKELDLVLLVDRPLLEP
jgi:CRP-like cAMP-binding protein